MIAAGRILLFDVINEVVDSLLHCMDALQPAVTGVFFHLVLQRPRLHIRLRPGQDISSRAAGAHLPAERDRVIRHGDRSYGSVALWLANYDSGARTSGHISVP